MEEIEIKILEINKDEVIKKLIKLGAKKVFDGPMNSIYLDRDKELRDTKKTLRIRQKGDKCIVTFKIKKEDRDVKIADEYETEVKDFEEAKLIFKNLGFDEYKTDFRNRVSYKLKNSLVEIDTFLKAHNYVPTFLEIESPNKEEIKEVAKLLDFSENQLKPWSGKEVLEYYKKKKK